MQRDMQTIIGKNHIPSIRYHDTSQHVTGTHLPHYCLVSAARERRRRSIVDLPKSRILYLIRLAHCFSSAKKPPQKQQMKIQINPEKRKQKDFPTHGRTRTSSPT